MKVDISNTNKDNAREPYTEETPTLVSAAADEDAVVDGVVDEEEATPEVPHKEAVSGTVKDTRAIAAGMTPKLLAQLTYKFAPLYATAVGVLHGETADSNTVAVCHPSVDFSLLILPEPTTYKQPDGPKYTPSAPSTLPPEIVIWVVVTVPVVGTNHNVELETESDRCPTMRLPSAVNSIPSVPNGDVIVPFHATFDA